MEPSGQQRAARIRRARLVTAAGLPGAALFLKLVVDLIGVRLDLVMLDAPTLESMQIRLALAALFALPALVGLVSLALIPESQAPSDRPRAHRIGGHPESERMGWLRPILISVLVGGLVIPGVPVLSRILEDSTAPPDAEAHADVPGSDLSMSTLRRSIRELARAQVDVHERTAAYSTTLSVLGWSPPRGYRAMLIADGTSWSVQVEQVGAKVGCAAWYGDWKPRTMATPGGVPIPTANRIVCDDP